MKNLIIIYLVFSISFLVGCKKVSNNTDQFADEYPEQFGVEVSNPSDQIRNNVAVELSIKSIKEAHSDFNPQAFIVLNDNKEIPSQIEDINGDRRPENLLFLMNFNPEEKKEISIRYSRDGEKMRKYPKRTQAVLGEKFDFKLVKGEYTGGRFQDVDSAKVPADHVAHDALYRIEGPGWESDLVTYRFYLDSRNRNDIFGKKINGLILQNVGVNDLVSNSQESYTKMLDWGMDIFKVGESLGIGSIAMWNDNKVLTISKVDSEITIISTNGPIRSDVYTKYYGWDAFGKKYNLFSNLSISAGSRLTKVDLKITGDEVNFCTGLAKHDSCDFIKSGNKTSGWGYIALYGKQSLSGDNLGIAVFFKEKDLLKNSEDQNSYIVVLMPEDGSLQYYFASAWDQEPDGIKNKDQFRNFLNQTADWLDNPVEAALK